jgi:hypothetical protein
MLSQSPPGPYPLGSTPVTLTVTDSRGATGECTGTVRVTDNTPPSITGASPIPSVLAPADSRIVNTAINYHTTDNCGQASCQLTGVTSNGPISSSSDYAIMNAHHVLLRATRLDTGDTRTYTIRISCTDASANKSTSSVTVTVPRYYQLPEYTLTVTKSGTGDGWVYTDLWMRTHPQGTRITLTPQPDDSSTFAGWSGACSGMSPTCVVVFYNNVFVNATFSAR